MAFFRTLIGAFHSRAVYQQARQATGYKLGYSFGLVALTTAIFSLGIILIVERMVFASDAPIFDTAVRQIASQLPAMTWHDGRLASEEATPITVHVEFNQASKPVRLELLTIDFTGTASASTMKTPLLLTPEELYLQKNEKIEVHPLQTFDKTGQTRIFSKSMIADLGEVVIRMGHRYRFYFYAITGIIGWATASAMLYVGRLMLLCTIAAAGLLSSRIMRAPITFSTAMRLTAVAYTPVAIIACIPIMLGLHVAPLTLFIAGSAMLVLAMRITRDTPLAAAQ